MQQLFDYLQFFFRLPLQRQSDGHHGAASGGIGDVNGSGAYEIIPPDKKRAALEKRAGLWYCIVRSRFLPINTFCRSGKREALL